MARYPQTAWQGSDDRHSSTVQARAARNDGPTIHEAISDFLAAAERGSALDRYGRAFSDESVRELRWCLTGHVEKRLGGLGLTEVRQRDVEVLVVDLEAAGLPRPRLRAIVKSVRALYDYAAQRGFVASNPAERVALPDEDDAAQPSRERPPALAVADRALALFLHVATVFFVLFALVLIAESL